MAKEESEEYLEAMLDLSKDGGPVRTTALSRWLKVSPASVTEALQRLAGSGMADYEPYKGASLTPKGRAAASRIKRKHRLLEVFLTKVLRMNRNKAHDEACKLEHALSDEAEKALCRELGGPESCPDGDAIPPCNVDVDSCAACMRVNGPIGTREGKGAVPLASLSPNRKGRVVFVRGGRAVVKRLCELGLTPGTLVALLRSAPMSGPVEVRVRGCDLALGRGIANKIFVEPEGRDA